MTGHQLRASAKPCGRDLNNKSHVLCRAHNWAPAKSIGPAMWPSTTSKVARSTADTTQQQPRASTVPWALTREQRQHAHCNAREGNASKGPWPRDSAPSWGLALLTTRRRHLPSVLCWRCRPKLKRWNLPWARVRHWLLEFLLQGHQGP
jgi:hypothetical protein